MSGKEYVFHLFGAMRKLECLIDIKDFISIVKLKTDESKKSVDLNYDEFLHCTKPVYPSGDGPMI